MQTINISEILEKPQEFPSMDYMMKKEFLDFINLKKEVALKEAEFWNCLQSESRFALNAMRIEQQLGELYNQLMAGFKRTNKCAKTESSAAIQGGDVS